MLREIRKQYDLSTLNENDAEKSGFDQFQKWLNDAVNSTEAEPTAMVVSTVDSNLQPHSRIVLLKDLNEHGLVFFTNYESNKSIQISKNNKVAVLFFWETFERQVRITGTVEKISEQASNDYFYSRPLESRIGAYASPQSRIIPNKEFLIDKFEEIKSKFGDNVPKPEKWGGFLIRPETFEFWQGRPNRMHDRLLYSKNADGYWQINRLAP